MAQNQPILINNPMLMKPKKKTLTDNIVDMCVDEFNKPNIKNKVKTNIVDPIVKDINERYYYQFLMLIILLTSIVIILLMVLSKLHILSVVVNRGHPEKSKQNKIIAK